MVPNKTYYVSLCCKVPINYNVEVEAANTREAKAKAIKNFENNYNADNLAEEPEWQEIELDLGTRDAGVYIERKGI